MYPKIICHVDVNSAFLSWTAAHKMHVLGQSLDLRKVPSAIGGDETKRHGIILAKSIPAKKYGIQTGEPIASALRKCPDLIIEPPNYDLYVDASRKLISALNDMVPAVQQYSIDEAWIDMSGTQSEYGPPLQAALFIKDNIRERFGFTVNIGVSTNTLLAKMAGDFQKPDKVHSLFPHEIEQKLWPLDADRLFMVGPATKRKLEAIGIHTIGDIAKTDPMQIKAWLGKHGTLIWNYANGIADESIDPFTPLNKGYGNSTTTAQDVTDARTAKKIFLSLCETVGMRMRKDGQEGACVGIHIRTNKFENASIQMKLSEPTNITDRIYTATCTLFDKLWDKKTPLRQLGVHMSKVSRCACRQYSLFDCGKTEKLEKLDAAIDSIRERFGETAVYRACFLNDDNSPLGGGLHARRRTGITKPV